MDYYPRYPVCGGWKVDWEMGYMMPTKYHLSLESDSRDRYILEIPFLHNFDVLLAESYTVEVILPYGATDVRFEVPFEIDDSVMGRSELTLDFFGTPKLILHKSNAFSMLHDKVLKVTYRFDERYNLIKPLGLSVTVFGFYLLAILYSRITLSFDDQHVSKDKAKSVKID